MRSRDDDTSILPLLASSRYNNSSNNNNNHNNSGSRRQRTIQVSDLVRFLTRRKLKFYIFSAILLGIVIITIIHRNSLRSPGLGLGSAHRKDGDSFERSDQQPPKRKSRFETRTMRTIIGKYVGPKPDWALNAAGNLSDEILNANNYEPDPDMGRDGRPVYLPGYPKERMQMLYMVNRFNLVVSDKISVDRKLPDPRKVSCKRRKFDLAQLPNTSVIIVFHNEAWSTLARTVHSILNTSPQRLLAEILLVDDASERTFLGKSLDYYMNNLASVRGVDIRVLRSRARIGLIGARLLGVRAAKGEVLTFIDAHCEATAGWLEPLLEQIKLNRKSAACPIIDIINEDNFAFTRSFELHLGAFNWGLNFRWYPISRREIAASNGNGDHGGKGAGASGGPKAKFTELTKPFGTPIMAGGLFSIDRKYFEQIGSYDPQMDIWGGENIELSLRLWQCGGQVKIVPCSHVAHIFRKSSPYTFRPGKDVGDILYTNLARLAEVWMDDWREFFYARNPVVNRTLSKVGHASAFAHIDARKQLRTELQCKSFEWFLSTVWPEHFFPHPSRFFGRIQQSTPDGPAQCLQRPAARPGSGQAPVGAADTGNCSSGPDDSGPHANQQQQQQLFVYNEATQFLMTDENVCLDSGSDPIPSRQAILAPCSESERQKWAHTSESFLKHVKSGLCLDSPRPRRVQLEICDASKPSLKWTFVDERWH